MARVSHDSTEAGHGISQEILHKSRIIPTQQSIVERSPQHGTHVTLLGYHHIGLYQHVGRE